MLDLKFIRKNKTQVEKAMTERGMKSLDFEGLFVLDEQRKKLLESLDSFIKKKKALQNHIERSAFFKKSIDAHAVKDIKEINRLIKKHENDLEFCQKKIKDALLTLPNITDLSVPHGAPGEPNKTLHFYAQRPVFKFPARTYLEIAKNLDIVDFSDSLHVLGLDIVFYKGLGARLYRAVINFLMDLHVKHSYQELTPPVMADGGPVLKLLAERSFKETELPSGYAIYTLKFRKDWDYAKDPQAQLKRVKQFDCLELINIVKEEDAEPILKKMVQEAEEALRLLELPYEVSLFTRGNLDYAAKKAYSIKVFLPGLDNSLEISVCSHLGDYFSKTMDISYKSKTSGKKYAHILSAANLIIPRVLMGILENFQQADGTVMIPNVLRRYMDGVERIGEP